MSVSLSLSVSLSKNVRSRTTLPCPDDHGACIFARVRDGRLVTTGGARVADATAYSGPGAGTDMRCSALCVPATVVDVGTISCSTECGSCEIDAWLALAETAPPYDRSCACWASIPRNG